MLLLVLSLVVVAALMLAAVALYNGLVAERNAVDSAWVNVDVALKLRADLVPNLVETVRGYMPHERETIEAVVAARASLVQASTPAEAAAADGDLSAALGKRFAVAEAYPQLRASENFAQLQGELVGTENRVALARQSYNVAVLIYENAARCSPLSWWPPCLGSVPASISKLTSPPVPPPRPVLIHFPLQRQRGARLGAPRCFHRRRKLVTR